MKSLLLVLLVCLALPLGVLSSSSWSTAELVNDLSESAVGANEVMVGLELTSESQEATMPAGDNFDADSDFHMATPIPTQVDGSFYPQQLSGPTPIPSYDPRAPWHLSYWSPPTMSLSAARMYGGVDTGSMLEAQSQGEDMATAPSSFVETEADSKWRGLRRHQSHSARFHSTLRRLRYRNRRFPYYARHAYGYNTPAFGFGGNGYAGQVTDIHPYSTRLYHPGYVAGFTNDRRHQAIPLPPQMPFLPPPPYTTPRPIGSDAAPAASSF